MKWPILLFLRLYQASFPIRQHLYTSIGIQSHACRQQPSCSMYAHRVILRYGTIRGIKKTLIRLSNCHS